MQQIPFCKVIYTDAETEQALQCLKSGSLQGDGPFTKKVQAFFENRYHIKKALFTTSCTDALELSGLLLDLKPGDEVIMPSYTFSSTANAFALRGAKIVFADSSKDHPNMDASLLESLITNKTKAVIPMHYAGFACDMDLINQIATKHKIQVVADAAQAIEAKYKGRPVADLAEMSTYSFHQTKNLSCGEGGMLVMRSEHFASRAEIIREKGTNRAAFFRGQVDKYTCVDIGSSYLGSDLLASVLAGQMDRVDDIQKQRMHIWNSYDKAFRPLEGRVSLPTLLPEREHNAHCYYLVCQSLDDRTKLIRHLSEQKISAPFHYLSLHASPFYRGMHDGRDLKWSDRYTDCLVRMPLYAGMTDQDIDRVIQGVQSFLKK